MKPPTGSIFDEQYRVVSVESDRLVIQGVVSGKVLTVTNPEPNASISPQDYPPGKLITLNDPSMDTHN